MNELDDLIRDALDAEARAVAPDTDAAWERLDVAAARRRWRPTTVLAVAAAAAITLVVAAVVVGGTDDDELNVGPATSGASTSAPSSTTGATSPGRSGAPPNVVVGVQEDGWLYVFDRATGDTRRLVFGGDPQSPPVGQEEGGPSYIDGVDLSPDGRHVYYSTCCEPASGTTYRIPVVGGTPERVGDGAFPRVSPDGRWIATSAGPLILVRPVPQPGEAMPAVTYELECCARDLAWSPDGTKLAFAAATGAPDDTSRVEVLRFDGATLVRDDQGKPVLEGRFPSWSPDGTLHVLSGGTGSRVDGMRSSAQDASYAWLVEVESDGRVVYRRLADGEIVEVPAVPRSLVADW